MVKISLVINRNGLFPFKDLKILKNVQNFIRHKPEWFISIQTYRNPRKDIK